MIQNHIFYFLLGTIWLLCKSIKMHKMDRSGLLKIGLYSFLLPSTSLLSDLCPEISFPVQGSKGLMLPMRAVPSFRPCIDLSTDARGQINMHPEASGVRKRATHNLINSLSVFFISYYFGLLKHKFLQEKSECIWPAGN